MNTESEEYLRRLALEEEKKNRKHREYLQGVKARREKEEERHLQSLNKIEIAGEIGKLTRGSDPLPP